VKHIAASSHKIFRFTLLRRPLRRWLKILTENNPAERIFIFVLEDKDKNISGSSVAGKSRELVFDYDGELHAIYLSKKLHGQGLGRLMFDQCTQACRELGLKNMFAWVLRDNPAINFYIHLKAKEFNAKSIEIGGKQLEEVALGWDKI
jgi:GNAT superfamily N-acetyltransferase